MCGSKLRLLIADRRKRSIFVLAALDFARMEFTVSALTRFSWRSVSALTRFSRRTRKRTYGFLLQEKRRASSGGMSAVALYLEFGKRTSLRSDLFPNSIGVLICYQLIKTPMQKKTENGKMNFCKLQKSLFRLPSSVFRHYIFVFWHKAQSTLEGVS